MRPSSSSDPRLGDPTPYDRFNRPLLDRRRAPEPIGYHVTIRLDDDRPIATSPAALRSLARVVLAQGETRGLLAFGAADDHLHVELATDRASAGAFAKYVQTALCWRLRLGARFERARIRPLYNQKHAYNTFHYVHRQDARHELDLDRAREGTSLPDLLELRLLGTSLCARVRAHLPRFRREELVGQFPVGVFDQTSTIALDVLADAAAAALALPDLRGQSVDVSRARRAAVHVAGQGVRTELLSDCLGITTMRVQALRLMPTEPGLLYAVERQMALRTAVQKRGG